MKVIELFHTTCENVFLQIFEKKLCSSSGNAKWGETKDRGEDEEGLVC